MDLNILLGLNGLNGKSVKKHRKSRVRQTSDSSQAKSSKLVQCKKPSGQQLQDSSGDSTRERTRRTESRKLPAQHFFRELKTGLSYSDWPFLGNCRREITGTWHQTGVWCHKLVSTTVRHQKQFYAEVIVFRRETRTTRSIIRKAAPSIGGSKKYKTVAEENGPGQEAEITRGERRQ